MYWDADAESTAIMDIDCMSNLELTVERRARQHHG
jgi:hypothetical protein